MSRTSWAPSSRRPGMRSRRSPTRVRRWRRSTTTTQISSRSTCSCPQSMARKLRFGRFIVDLAGRQALAGYKQLPLTPTEFKLLRTLAGEPGRVFTRDDLLVGVWSYEPGSDTRLVDVHVGRLRKKLEQAQVSELSIETARGFGYRLIERPN